MRKYVGLAISMSLTGIAMAQAPVAAAEKSFFEATPFEILAPFLAGVLLLVIVLVLLFGITVDLGQHYRNVLIKEGKELPWIVRLFGVFEGDSTAFTGVATDQLMDGHEYDGIREYDNDLPPWWKWMFYVTGVFGIAYMLHYHVLGTGTLMEGEYKSEIEEAEKLYANVDITYKEPTKDKEQLSAAQTIFASNCAACHGNELQGGVGPNLTDEYWLHKGGVNDIYKTIKYGVIDKGMKDWKSEFSNKEIYALSSYILSKAGSNPANAKEPQGEKQ